MHKALNFKTNYRSTGKSTEVREKELGDMIPTPHFQLAQVSEGPFGDKRVQTQPSKQKHNDKIIYFESNFQILSEIAL